ncbi:unnamed protein product [Rhizophagus irregularis]|nr:unnamed protein product [Rhizophagus irregularis]
MTCLLKIFDSSCAKYALDLSIEEWQLLYRIENEFKEAEDYRKSHLFSSKEKKENITHSQAIYTSRLLNPLTKELIYDFTK